MAMAANDSRTVHIDAASRRDTYAGVRILRRITKGGRRHRTQERSLSRQYINHTVRRAVFPSTTAVPWQAAGAQRARANSGKLSVRPGRSQ